MSGSLTPSTTTRKNAATKYPPEQNGKERRAGLISKADYLKSIDRFRVGTGTIAGSTLLDGDQYAFLSANRGIHISSGVKVRGDNSAWDYYQPSVNPSQIVIIRSDAGVNTIEYYDSPVAANPAAHTQRMSLTPWQFVQAFDPPRARVRRITTSAINNTTPTPFTWQTHDSLITDGYNNTSTFWNGSTALVAPWTGWYLFSGWATFFNSSGGVYRELSIRQDGVTTLAANTDSPHTASFFVVKNVCTIAYLTAGQYVELVAYQDSGGVMSMPVSAAGPAMYGMFLCA